MFKLVIFLAIILLIFIKFLLHKTLNNFYRMCKKTSNLTLFDIT